MYQITSTVNGITVDFTNSFAGMNQAIWFGEAHLVKPVLERPEHIPGRPVTLTVTEIGPEEPEHYEASYGGPEDAPLHDWHLLAYIAEDSPRLYYTRCGAWVEEVTLAKLYKSYQEAEEAILEREESQGWENVAIQRLMGW